MRNWPKTIAIASLAMVLTASVVLAFPKPSVYPVSWQYKFDYNKPKRIAVRTPGDAAAQGYWYMTFTLTNKDIDDPSVRFLPIFELLTREGKIIRSDKEVPPNVYEEISRREGHKLEPLDKIRGKILMGEDQARDGVCVWPEPAPRMGTFSIFFSGLSGETIYLDKEGKLVDTKDWTKISEDEKKAFISLRKTLEVTYTIPGDEMYPGEDAVNFVKQEWLMR